MSPGNISGHMLKHFQLSRFSDQLRAPCYELYVIGSEPCVAWKAKSLFPSVPVRGKKSWYGLSTKKRK